MMRYAPSVILNLAAMLVISCGSAATNSLPAKPNTATPTPAATPTTAPSAGNTAPPPVSRVKSLPPEGGDKPTRAEFNGYTYSFKTDATKTVATFAPRLLPAQDDLLFGAVRDIISRSYGEKADAAPRLVGTGAEQSIRIAGKKYDYLIVPIRETTGEIQSLMVTQLRD